MKFYNILIWILFSCTSPVFAIDLDLKTAIDEALDHSPIVQKSKSNLEGARWKKIEGYSGFLPTITGNADYLFAKKYALVDVAFNGTVNTIPQIIPTTQFSLTSELPLFDGLSNVQRYQSDSNVYESAQNDYEWMEFKTEMDTTLQFYKVLVATNLMDVAQQNLKTVEDHLKDVTALQRAGIATKFDVLRVEVQKDEAQTDVLKSQDEYEIAKAKLAENMGKPSDSRTPAGKIPALPASLLDKFTLDSSKRQDILSLRHQEESLRHLYKSEGRFWVPRVSLYGQALAYNNLNDEFADWDSYRNAYQVGFSLDWKIFDAAVSLSRTKQANAQYLVQKEVVSQSYLDAEKDIQIWKRRYEYFGKIIDVRRAENEKAIESNRLASESLKAGTKTTGDLLDAQLDLFKSRYDILIAQIGLIEALINLELATGQKVYDFTQNDGA